MAESIELEPFSKVGASVIAENNDDGTPKLADSSNGRGDRPACFKSTLQEMLFIFIATMAMGQGVILTGAVTVISTFVGRDLNMTTAQVTWITASNKYVCRRVLVLIEWII